MDFAPESGPASHGLGCGPQAGHSFGPLFTLENFSDLSKKSSEKLVPAVITLHSHQNLARGFPSEMARGPGTWALNNFFLHHFSGVNGVIKLPTTSQK